MNLFKIGFAFLLTTNIVFVVTAKNNEDTLKLVHLIFRHGERTTDASTLYPYDPHINETYYPYGLGQLTNRGKQTEYRLGKKLRRRYNKFLGEVYTPDALQATATETDRAKASLQLVLAGLYPPKATAVEWENELNWQPIPYQVSIFADDPLMTYSNAFCPAYIEAYKAYLNTPEGRKLENKYANIYSPLTTLTGKSVQSTEDLRLLYYALVTELEWGLELPRWSQYVFPETLEEGTIDFFIQSCATTKLKQLSGGFLLKKIINDSNLKLTRRLMPQDRKLFLYSGHEFNIAFLLGTMEVFFPHSPPYGSCIMIEVHTIQNVDGIKVFYEDYTQKEPKEPKLLKIPGCDYFCPFEQFVKLLEKNLPQSDNACELEQINKNN